MKRYGLWLLAGLGFSLNAAAQTAVQVPTELRGTWKADLQYCQTADDDSVLTIGRRELHYYEAGGTVRKITRQGGRYVLEVDISDETGARHRNRIRLSLADNGKRLIEHTAHGTQTRYRCH